MKKSGTDTTRSFDRSETARAIVEKDNGLWDNGQKFYLLVKAPMNFLRSPIRNGFNLPLDFIAKHERLLISHSTGWFEITHQEFRRTWHGRTSGGSLASFSPSAFRSDAACRPPEALPEDLHERCQRAHTRALLV